MANETQDTVPPIQKGQPVQAEPTTTGEAPVPKVKLSRRQFLKGLRDDALVSASMLVAPAIQTPPRS